jgi:hypothetical protein
MAVFLSGKAFGYLQPGRTRPWFWRPPIAQAGKGEDFQAQAGAWISIYQLTCSSVQKVGITVHYRSSHPSYRCQYKVAASCPLHLWPLVHNNHNYVISPERELPCPLKRVRCRLGVGRMASLSSEAGWYANRRLSGMIRPPPDVTRPRAEVDA